MPVKPRGAAWQAAVSYKGQRVRRDFSTKQEAMIWEAQTKAALMSGTFKEASEKRSAFTLGELFQIVADTHWRGTKGEKTALINAGHVLEILGKDRDVASLCYDDALQIKREVAGWKRSDATINRKLAALSYMVNEAVKMGKLDKPFTVGLIKERKTRVRFYTDDEVKAMLAWCDQVADVDLRDYIIISIDTGFRQGEVLKITKRDAEQDDLWTYDTKAGDNRDVPVTARVREILDRRSRGINNPDERLIKRKPDDLRDRWKHMQSALGMADDRNYVPHVLRHTFVSNMLQMTDIRTVQELAGHKRIETTQRYAHTSAERKKLAIQKLSEYQATA